MAASQFDYAKMVTAQAELEQMGNEIAQFVLDIAANANGMVAKCYTGEAADAYTTAFKNVADSVNAAIKDISNKLSTELTQQQADYAAKEAQMVESVAVPPLSN